jgi:hypothetical protein
MNWANDIISHSRLLQQNRHFSDLTPSAAQARDTTTSGHCYSSTARVSRCAAHRLSLLHQWPDGSALSRDKSTRRANHFGFSEIM